MPVRVLFVVDSVTRSGFSPSICSWQKDKCAKPGNLLENNALSEIRWPWYCHLFIKGSRHTGDPRRKQGMDLVMQII